MDDYYKNTNDVPKDQKGNLDFECLDEQKDALLISLKVLIVILC